MINRTRNINRTRKVNRTRKGRAGSDRVKISEDGQNAMWGARVDTRKNGKNERGSVLSTKDELLYKNKRQQ